MPPSQSINSDLTYTKLSQPKPGRPIGHASSCGDPPCEIYQFPGSRELSKPESPKATKKSVSVIIPVLNEAENLAEIARQTCDAFLQTERKFEVIFVDDGSTDQSAEILRSLVDEEPSIRVERLARNYGQTAAISAGIDSASGDYVVTLDGDLQNDPADAAKMLEHLDAGADIVFGWRRNRHDGWARKQASKIANWLVRSTTGVRANDLGCTLKAMTRRAADQMELCGDMHRFIPVLANQLGLVSCEIEVNHRPRTRGETKYGFERIPKVVQDLVTLAALRHRANPMRFFGSWSLKFGFVSVVAFAAAIASFFIELPLWVGLIFASGGIIFGIASFQFISIGVMAELNCRRSFEAKSHDRYRIKEAFGRRLGNAESIKIAATFSTDEVFADFSANPKASRAA